MQKQTHHTATFKAQVVLEMLKEEKTVAQIASDHHIHPGQLHRSKRQALQHPAQAHDQELMESPVYPGPDPPPLTTTSSRIQVISEQDRK